MYQIFITRTASKLSLLFESFYEFTIIKSPLFFSTLNLNEKQIMDAHLSGCKKSFGEFLKIYTKYFACKITYVTEICSHHVQESRKGCIFEEGMQFYSIGRKIWHLYVQDRAYRNVTFSLQQCCIKEQHDSHRQSLSRVLSIIRTERTYIRTYKCRSKV